jgi:hypothetical protein
MSPDKTNALISAAFDVVAKSGLRVGSLAFDAAVASMESEKTPFQEAIAALATASAYTLAARHEEVLLTLSDFGRSCPVTGSAQVHYRSGMDLAHVRFQVRIQPVDATH